MAKTALLSAYRKDPPLAAFAQMLRGHGFDLLASAGTKKFLDGYSIPSRDVAELVGPPILGHRVVTLSREIHAGLLARAIEEDDIELARIGVPRIDLVYVDLYPLQAELAKADATSDSIRNMIDVGGPTLIRSANKGCRWVLTSPDQLVGFAQVFSGIQAGQILEDEARRYRALLASRAETVVAHYAQLTASFYERESL